METTQAPSPAETPSGKKVRPRAPSRSTSLTRYTALLDATEALLQDENPAAVGLYQIAERAGVPPASVYHFFPTKEAAFLALAQRHLKGFEQLTRRPIPVKSLSSWQALTAWDLRNGVDYYNANSPASKLFLGGFGGLETRQADREYVEAVARAAYQRLDRIFHMPFLRDPQKKFHTNIQIVDAVLAISFVQNGAITEDYYEEALTVSVAYCRTFLPEHLELRPQIREAIDLGEATVSLWDGAEQDQ